MKRVFIITLCIFFWFGCTHTNRETLVDYQEISHIVIDSLINQSKNQYAIGVKPEFDVFLKEAIEVSRNSGDTNQIFAIYMIIARRYRNASKYSYSLEILQQALSLATLNRNDLMKAQTIHEMAVNFRKLNDNAQALKFHTQALELAENIKDTFLIHCSYNGMGNVYFDYKDYHRAIDYFHKSLQHLGTQKPNYLGEAINTNLLGEAWLFIGNADSALHYLKQSYAANIKINSDLGKGICHNGMGLVYNHVNDYLKAEVSFNAAVTIFESLNDLFYLDMALTNLGKNLLLQKRYAEAEKHLKRALDIALQIGSKQYALDASIKLSQLYIEIGMNQKSYEFSQLALAYKDSITYDLQHQNTDAMNMLYKAEKQEREILILKQDAELAVLKISRQRYLFLAVTLLIGIAIVLVLLGFRQRRLRSRFKEISLEQKLLRAQLNPHFVFNSLSAIQNFILKSDKQAASDYLVNFSRLMRNILMSSGTDFIPLAQELEVLDDYLKLQRLRFMGKFDSYFEIDNAIDPQKFLVPPMLIQPFVENAIEHGVRDIDRQGVIIIRFISSGKSMVIEVEDNGRGIQHQQNNPKKEGHISMALKITKQRLQVLQSVSKKSCKYELIDKTEQGSSGVLIRITIPVQIE